MLFCQPNTLCVVLTYNLLILMKHRRALLGHFTGSTSCVMPRLSCRHPQHIMIVVYQKSQPVLKEENRTDARTSKIFRTLNNPLTKPL